MRKKSTPWPRWAKIVRNLLLVLLLSIFIWDLLGKPLPYEAALRRLERQYLIPEAEHSTEIPLGNWRGNVRVDWSEYAAMASIRVLRAASPRPYYYYDPIAEIYRLTEGPNLLALPWSTFVPGNEVGTMDTYAVYAAIDPPEGSVTAELTLHGDGGVFTASGQREDGVYIFYVPSEANDEQTAYELMFYDADGELLDIVRNSDRKGAEP